MQDYTLAMKNLPSLFPFESKHFNPSHFTGFSKIKNLYITGHTDGTIIFWDVTCSLLIPLLSLTQQVTGLSSSYYDGINMSRSVFLNEFYVSQLPHYTREPTNFEHGNLMR